MRRTAVLLTTLALLAALTAARPALAKGPPDALRVSGPGLAEQVTVEDAALIRDLGIGALEDFSSPTDAPAGATGGYQIDRLIRDQGAMIAMDRLVYYPPAGGGRGTVFYAGMAAVGFGSSDRDGHWFRATASGDAAMARLLTRLLPAGPQPAGLPRTGAPPDPAPPAALAAGLLLLGGAILLARRRRGGDAR